MIGSIDDHRQDYEVEPIFETIAIAPSTYYEHKARQADPSRRPPGQERDEAMRVEIRRVFDGNLGMYGVRKVRIQLKRAGRVRSPR